MSRFDHARRQALVRDILAQLFNRPVNLLPFDEVRETLRLKSVVDRGVREVPLDRIVGTVGREREFTRAFLPRQESLRERWEDVSDLAEGQRGFPPVELYQVGEAYFVVDGHHRVSVARSFNAPTIEARVREYPTLVPLDPQSSIEDVFLKRGLADFLETTGLSPELPDEYRVTEPDGYQRLLDHIAVHRHFRGTESKRFVPVGEAALSWRDSVYRPMIATIGQSRVIEDFPDRTCTDLYLFLMEHRHYLRERYSESATRPARVVKHFRLQQRSQRKQKRPRG